MPCHLPKIAGPLPVLLPSLGSHFLVTPIHSMLPHRPGDLDNYVVTRHDDWRTDLSIAVVQTRRKRLR